MGKKGGDSYILNRFWHILLLRPDVGDFNTWFFWTSQGSPIMPQGSFFQVRTFCLNPFQPFVTCHLECMSFRTHVIPNSCHSKHLSFRTLFIPNTFHSKHLSFQILTLPLPLASNAGVSVGCCRHPKSKLEKCTDSQETDLIILILSYKRHTGI